MLMPLEEVVDLRVKSGDLVADDLDVFVIDTVQLCLNGRVLELCFAILSFDVFDLCGESRNPVWPPISRGQLCERFRRIVKMAKKVCAFLLVRGV